MKRKAMTVMFLLGCLSLCGCGKSSEKAEISKNQEPEKLVLWSYFETGAQRQGLDKMIRDFNQSQNKYRASWEYIPMTGFVKGLSSAYTENNLPDMAILDNPDMPTLIQLGMFEDITEQVKKWKLETDFYPSIVDTLKYQDRYYGIPFNCNSTALIYNKTILEQENIQPPTTWEELRNAARKLTKEGRSGFTMCCIEGEQGAFQILPWILAAGENPQKLGGKATEEAFQFFYTLLDDGIMPENCINLTQTDVARELADGKTAIIQNGPWVFPILDEANIDYGIIPIPGKNPDNAVLGGENIGILKGKNIEGSLEFLQFCMEGTELTDFCQMASVLPGQISAAAETVKNDTRMTVFEQQMDTAIARTSIPYWVSVSQKLTDGMYSLIAGQSTPAQIAASFLDH